VSLFGHLAMSSAWVDFVRALAVDTGACGRISVLATPVVSVLRGMVGSLVGYRERWSVVVCDSRIVG
jgi:hypothetical protein